MRGFGLVSLVVALALGAAPPGARSADRQSTLAVYGGVGSWVDIFAGSVWRRPASVVPALRAQGVSTLYVQTSNYSQRADVVRPAALSALVDAAHAAGIEVVAWYLPSFARPADDARRALAAIRFRTRTGQRFDSFALDIEASVVRDVRVRNARLLALSRLLRRSVAATYPLGAIIPSPVGMLRHPHYWPGFPYAELSDLYDAMLPMAYFTHYTTTATGAYAYARDVVTLLRASTSPDLVIHLIGGLASGAPLGAFAAFDRAAAECGVDGLSLYAFQLTSPAEWALLAKTVLGAPPAPTCAG